MRVLAIDTATFTASVAVVDVARGAVLAEAALEAPSLSAALLPLAERCLQAADVTRAQVEAIAVGAGPGTFTGLRIGLATAKGLAFALDRPLWVASSLTALAWDAAPLLSPGTMIAAALDARRGEVYAGLFAAEPGGVAALASERVLAPAELATWAAAVAPGRSLALVGDARDAYPDALSGWPAMPAAAPRTPRAAAVALVAAAGDRVSHLDGGAPAYVRRPEVELMYPDGVPGAARRVR